MAKLQDKFFNRVIEGDLELGQNEKNQINELLGSGDVPAVKADEIIENMSGYSFIPVEGTTYADLDVLYAGACKNGNKLTLVMFMTFTYEGPAFRDVGSFKVPKEVYDKLTPYTLGGVATLDVRTLDLVKERQIIPSNAYGEIFKAGNNIITFSFAVPNSLTANATYAVRYEATFLLSDNLAPQE